MIKIKKLNSGITLVMEKIPYFRSISIGIWVRAGAVDESGEYSGISHFIEHMMFKGTRKRSAKQIAEDIDRIGGRINAFTGKETTCYYVKAVSDNYAEAADVLTDMLSDSVFDAKEMDKERQVICEEIKMLQDTPEDLVNETVISTVFHGEPLGRQVIGDPVTLARIDRGVMARYVKNQYTKDSIVISVCGNYDEEEICSYFDDKLDSLEASKPEGIEKAGDYTPKFRCVTKDIKQTHICLAVRAVPAADPSYYAFSVLNNIMGGSMSSRLFQKVREQRGLAYSVYSMLGTFARDGYFNIYAGVSHEKAEEAINAIRSELRALEKEGVTKEELGSSKEQLKAAYIFEQENPAVRMFKNGKDLILNGRVTGQEEVTEGFNSVTMEDIEEVKQKICDFSLYSGAAVSGRKLDMKKIMGG